MKYILQVLNASLVFVVSSTSVFGITENYSFSSLALSIPDGNPSGLANNQPISSSAITNIQAVEVSLDISGTYNGDIYAYLAHDLGFSVLLNRSGRTAGDAFGYDDDGFNVTFSDSAANDIHTYQDQLIPSAGSPLTGTWIPDGRNVDPDLVLDTDAQTSLLSSFIGGNANGDWDLFVADLSSGELHTLNSWSLQITGVPEPAYFWCPLFVFGVLVFRRLREKSCSQ